MTIQELIDKIEEMKSEAKFSPQDEEEELKDRLNKIHKTCENILLDWKVENARCMSQMKAK